MCYVSAQGRLDADMKPYTRYGASMSTIIDIGAKGSQLYGDTIVPDDGDVLRPQRWNVSGGAMLELV